LRDNLPKTNQRQQNEVREVVLSQASLISRHDILSSTVRIFFYTLEQILYHKSQPLARFSCSAHRRTTNSS